MANFAKQVVARRKKVNNDKCYTLNLKQFAFAMGFGWG
jgi:hypothetical protein